ncbi:hypothetical protein [Tritonibacter mobilis]|uniref:hypothetical protein n=1 Tax=Tritonibacter mobilis TaxID=379347 RepID=UPI000806C6C6|nr:hypothetical protein [Tritonibacter mobilis]GLP86305.1 hypothetical protein GCM10007921_18650 [Tritonibacter mobilis]SDX16401.1 hypothetical protein SAMN05444385_105158 [Tritonibacter mobilis]
MATSTEQINNLIGAYTDLKVYFEGAKDGIEDALAAAASRYQGFFSTVHVDQAAGNDANNGTADAPVASIQRAIDLSPHDGFNMIKVRGNYTATVRVVTNGRMLSIIGCIAGSEWATADDPAQRPTLTIGYYDISGFAEVAGFHCGYDTYIDVIGFKIQLPSLADVTAALPGSNTGSTNPRGLFAIRSSSHGRAGSVALRYCELIVPADYYGAIFSAGIGWYLLTTALTINGDIAGKVHPEVPAAAVSDDYVRFIQTTMATL